MIHIYMNYPDDELFVLLSQFIQRYNKLSIYNPNSQTTQVLRQQIQAIKEVLEMRRRENYIQKIVENNEIINPHEYKSVIITRPLVRKKNEEEDKNQKFLRGVVLETDALMREIDKLEQEREDLIDLMDKEDDFK